VAKTQQAQKAPEPSGDSAFDAIRERLLNQRQEILNMYKQDVRAGQESADDGTEDIVDRANNSYNRELMFSLSDGERVLLLQIEDALRRMDEGAYGRCNNCGQNINILRLQAVPWTRYCIDCQELAEKGLLSEDAS
jgi:DnaK suppressor protein